MASSRTATLCNALLLEPWRMVAGLWPRRELIWQFTHRAIEVRHRGSRLGALWALINPLTMLALYFFIFGKVFRSKFEAIPGETDWDLLLALFLGLILFHVFTETLAAAPLLITSNPNFVKKVVFPLEVLPVAHVGAAVFHFGVAVALVIVGSIFGSTGLSFHVLWLPLIVLPMVLLALGVGWLLAALGVFLRDIGQVTGFIATALLFASAVMYPPSKIPHGFEFLHYNPLLQVIDLARRVVLWHEPLAWGWLAYVYGWALAALAVGAVFFSLLRKSFAEVL